MVAGPFRGTLGLTMCAARHRSAEPSQTILDAATLVFARRGYAAATIEDIARQAGFSHQTVRDRFADKPHLWQAVMREGWDRLLAMVARKVARGATPPERARGAAEAMMSVALESAARASVLLRCDPAAPATDDAGDLRRWLASLFEAAGAPQPSVTVALLLGTICRVCRAQTDGPADEDLRQETLATVSEILRLALGD